MVKSYALNGRGEGVLRGNRNGLAGSLPEAGGSGTACTGKGGVGTVTALNFRVSLNS